MWATIFGAVTPYLMWIKLAGLALLLVATSGLTHRIDMANIANERTKAANETITLLEKRAELKAEHEQKVQNAIEKAIQNQVVVDNAFAMSDKLHTIYTPSDVKAGANCAESKKLYFAAWQYARGLEQSCDRLQTRGTGIIKKGEQVNLSAIQAKESE